jgi:outer membrane protein
MTLNSRLDAVSDSSLLRAGTVVNFVASGIALTDWSQYEQFSCDVRAEFQRRIESMSRSILCIFLAIFWMPVVLGAQAADPPAATQSSAAISPAKIAWMNLEQAILTCDEGANLFREIQDFVDEKNSELDALRKESENLMNQLQVQGSKLTDEARADLEDQVETKDTVLQRFQQDTQKEIENRRVRTANYIGKRMQTVIEKISKERGLSAVMIYNSNRDAYIEPSLNITQEIIEAYNKTYPVSAPKTAVPAKTP